ncbi:MAG TPA: TIGR00725 family protein [Candidatus Eremiobacteraeota bacterium]|nr:MAG: putative lysine decarboxylase [bacterium ADurb.Bin363]HPZ07163.1 TIGR00725 family protein [Candidatus Eremiobacteraeota bacterium]
MYIGVIGQSQCNEEIASIAEEVGELIARNGAVMICGGMGGVMEAASRGARSAGGVTIGILPGFSREEANSYISISIPTGLGPARNLIIVRASDVLIAISGGYGTLTEIAFALHFGKPVIGLYTWGLNREGKDLQDIMIVRTPREAVSKAMELIKDNRQ